MALTFTVNTAADEGDLQLDNACRTVSGECSLRAALQEAESASARIRFEQSVELIALASELPVISTRVQLLASCDHPVVIQGSSILGHGLAVAPGGRLKARGLVLTGFTKEGDHGDPISNGTGLVLDSSRNELRCSELVGNRYGSIVTGERNRFVDVLASGNLEDGLYLGGTGARNNMIRGGTFGLTADRSAQWANGGDGIDIADGAAYNSIRGVYAAGNGSVGVEIRSDAHDNRIEQSTIGLTVDGQSAGNTKAGVKFLSPFNTVSRSRIAGHDKGVESFGTRAAGIEIEYPHNVVDRCVVGPNNGVGVAVLVGSSAVTQSSIVDNINDGIIVARDDDEDCVGSPDCTTENVLVSDNLIQGNGWSGIVLVGIRPDAPGENRRGTYVRNIIAGNGGDGISTYDYMGFFGPPGDGNHFAENAIFGNARIGIDLTSAYAPALSDGPTPNHEGVAAGPNALQNYPIVSEVQRTQNRLEVRLELASLPLEECAVEICGNSAGDPECRTVLHSTHTVTDAMGRSTITASVPDDPSVELITAIASCDGGDGFFRTSEISPGVTVP